MSVKLIWKGLSVARLVTFLICYLNCGIPLVICILAMNLLQFVTMAVFKYDLMEAVKFKEFW